MIEDKLAKYTYTLKYSDLSKETIHSVKRFLIDSIGCAIMAKKSKPVQIMKKFSGTVETNAMLYGTMIRFFDYNDIYISKTKEIIHPSENIGALIAVAEETKAPIKNFILACALAYEIQCGLHDVSGFRMQGWDNVVYGNISVGLAAGKLMGLNQEQLKQVINLTMTTNISTRQVRQGEELSMWKAPAFGNVARNAIFAAKMAKAGMKGPNNVFEGKYGVMKQLTGKFKENIDSFGKRKKKFRIDTCWIKKWPAETHAQSAIQAAIDLRKQIPKIKDIVKIEVSSHSAGYRIIGTGKEKWTPKTKETADHSIPYVVSTALVTGKVDHNSYSNAALTNKKVLNLAKKLIVKEDNKLERKYPKAAANRIKITLKQGVSLEKEVIYHKGHSKNPMTDEELEEKFHLLTRRYMNLPQRKKLLNSLWSMKGFKWDYLRKII